MHVLSTMRLKRGSMDVGVGPKDERVRRLRQGCAARKKIRGGVNSLNRNNLYRQSFARSGGVGRSRPYIKE
jgi:hypothetical protein